MIKNFMEANLLVILVLLINLLASVFYIIVINNEKLKNGFNNMNIIIQKLYVVFFITPLLISPFLSQSRLVYSSWIFNIICIVFILIGIIMILFSFLKIGTIPSIKKKSALLSSGVYKIVRHPVYSGNIFVMIGLFFLLRGYTTILYLPISILLYYLMTHFEEKDLVRMYGEDYLTYRKVVTKRIIPFVL